MAIVYFWKELSNMWWPFRPYPNGEMASPIVGGPSLLQLSMFFLTITTTDVW